MYFKPGSLYRTLNNVIFYKDKTTHSFTIPKDCCLFFLLEEQTTADHGVVYRSQFSRVWFLYGKEKIYRDIPDRQPSKHLWRIFKRNFQRIP